VAKAVAEHDDLELLELLGSQARRRELEKRVKYELAERAEQEFASLGRAGAHDSAG